jgi:hypothetical protein
MVRNHAIVRLLIGLLLLPTISVAETKEQTKSWSMAIITGPLSADKRIKYYLQPQLSLIDDKYKIHSLFGYVGVGYQLDSYKIIWLMNGYSWIKQSNGGIRHIDTIREQLNWNMSEVCMPYASSITRLEQRKNLDEPTWNFRLRQQILLRLPFESWPGHALVTFDEVFLNLNNPKWVHATSFFDQNRFFIGIGTTITPEVEFDIGYLNQYVFKNTDEMSNVLQMRLNVNFQ